MHSFDVTFAFLFLFFFAAVSNGTSQERDRAKIADKDKWDLSKIYSSDDAWQAAKEKIIKDIPTLQQYKGKLDQSADQLLACMDLYFGMSKEFSRLYSSTRTK